MDFARMLEKYRKEAGFTVRKLAEESGTQPGTITLCEQGKRTPPHKAIEAWAKALLPEGSKREVFILKGLRAKAAAHKDAMPYVLRLEKRWGGALDAVTDLLGLAHTSGWQIPQELLERLKSLLQIQNGNERT